MRPQTTVLQDFHWLMLDDNDPYEVPLQVLHSEPLSSRISTMNPPDTLPARYQHRAA